VVTNAEDEARTGRRRCRRDGDEFRLMIDGGGADGEDAVWRRLGEVGGSGRYSAADEHGVASTIEDVGDAAAVVLPLPRGCRLQLKLVNK